MWRRPASRAPRVAREDDLAVLFGTPRANVADAGAELLTRQCEEKRKLGSVIDLDLANLKRKRRGEFAEKRQAGAVVLASVQPQHPQARAIIDGGVLKPFLPIADRRAPSLVSTPVGAHS